MFEQEGTAFMEKALDLARRAGAKAEVYWSSGERVPVTFRAGLLKRVEAARRQAFALRVVREGRVGLSSTTVATDAAGLVEKALAGARYGPLAEFDFPSASPGPDTGQWWDERVADLDPEVMVEWGREFAVELKRVEPTALAHAEMERRAGMVRIINSSGLEVSYRKTTVEAAFIAEVTEEGNFLQVYRWDASARLDIDPQALCARVLADLGAARRNVPLPSGEYPVVFSPRAVRDLVGPILACADGRAVGRGISPWRERLGEQLFAPSLTLVDDGRKAGGAAAGLCDDEGVPTRATPIIARGVLRNFLLDLESAATLKLEPTGHGARGELAEGPPQPHPTELSLEPGDESLADLLARVKEGLLVEEFLGAWSGNLYAGVVTGNAALGFRLQGGEKAGRVKDCMLSVNVFTALREGLGGLSRERERSGSSFFPYVLVERATVTTPLV